LTTNHSQTSLTSQRARERRGLRRNQESSRSRYSREGAEIRGRTSTGEGEIVSHHGGEATPEGAEAEEDTVEVDSVNKMVTIIKSDWLISGL
jgi:hypothetical protein